MTDAEIFQLIKQKNSAAKLGIDKAEWQGFCGRMEKLWSSETDAAVIFNIDGGSKGNPGPAGIGIVISDKEGTLLGEHYEFIGEQTNNVAEYRALLKALELAREMNIDKVSVRTDSELLAKQISGKFQVKNAQLLPLYFSAEEAIRNFTSFTIENIPRALNQRADRLANLAISKATIKSASAKSQ